MLFRSFKELRTEADDEATADCGACNEQMTSRNQSLVPVYRCSVHTHPACFGESAPAALGTSRGVLAGDLSAPEVMRSQRL